jgi:hypothetical protein
MAYKDDRVVLRVSGQPNTACTRFPAKSAGATLASHVVCLANHAGVVVGLLASLRPRFQVVSVAWSWFRQSGVVPSHQRETPTIGRYDRD